MSLVKILCGASALGFVLISSMAEAQSNPSPPFIAQQPLTAAQLNAAFAAKSDYPGHTPVTSFNTRGGAVTLNSGDVTTAIGYTPLNPSNNLSDVASKPLALSNLSGLAHTSTLTTLSNLSTLSYGWVIRDSYAVAGDASPVTYYAGAAACSLGAGVGDGGSQVSSSNGKCWLAIFPASGVDIAEWGAKCDGSTNDVADIQLALNWASANGPSVLVRRSGASNCVVSSSLTVGGGVSLSGNGNGPGVGGFAAGAINLNPMFHITGNSVKISNLYINALAAGTNTSGAVIRTDNVAQTIIRDTTIHGPCTAIDISGNSPVVDNIYIDSAQTTSCNVIRVGTATTSAGTVDPSFNLVTVNPNPSSKPNSCMEIQDAGGLFVSHSSMEICNVGTLIDPGVNQAVLWMTGNDTYLGDTNVSGGIVINPTAASGVVWGFSCSNCWASSAGGGQGVWIQNTHGGTVAGVHFTKLRAYKNSSNGFEQDFGTTDVSVNDSQLCSNGGSGIYLSNSVAGTKVIGNTSGSNCDGATGTTLNGLLLGGANTGLLVKDNILSGTTPCNNCSLSGNIVQDNLGYNPVGASSVSVGASPFTHTSGPTTETDYITGGTVSSVTASGVVACSASPCTVQLGPNESDIVTYSGLPTMNKVIH